MKKIFLTICLSLLLLLFAGCAKANAEEDAPPQTDPVQTEDEQEAEEPGSDSSGFVM